MVSRVLILLIFIFSLLNANNLKRMTINNSDIVLTFNKPITKHNLNAFIIPSKKIIKYVFDFKNCTKLKGVKSKYNISKNIKSIRVSQYKPNVVRLVIDSYKKYKISFFQKDGSSNFHIKLPTKITISKQSHSNNKTDDMFNKIDTKQISKTSNKTVKKINKPIKIGAVKLKKQYKIMIDPGHGAHDAGAIGGRFKEKNIVLQIARRVYRKLKTLGFNVAMTRYKDHFVKLSKRTRKANRMGADLFISIHANSVRNRNKALVAHGIETYFLDKARTARAKRIASIENSSMLNNKDYATKEVLLNAVFLGPKVQLSNRLAIDVQKEILKSLKSRYSYVKDGGVRGAPFRVLVGAQMPAILIETGYISNPKERKYLFNPDYQDALATGIVKGVINYLKNREKELE